MTQATPAANEEPQDDTQPQTEAAPQNEDALAAANAKIAELEKKVGEIKDQALRALAEAENTRKRGERDRQDIAKYAVTAFARDMLAVSDNLRRALNSILPGQRDKNPELNNIFTGVEATERELLRIFDSNGIKKVEPLGAKFDPNFHEVLFEAPTPGKAPGTVIQVIEAGYTLHDRLLRPARVGVAKGGETEAGSTVDKEV